MRDFHLDEADAKTVASAMDEYYQLIGTNKPYFFNKDDPADRQFSVTGNGDEGMRFVERCNTVVDILREVYERLPEENKTSFYQLVYYNAMALRDSAEEHIYFQKNRISAAQGRYGSAAVYEDLSKAAGQRIDDGVKEFNGQNGDKWTNMIKLTHPGGNYQRLKSSDYKTVTVPSAGVGAACENQDTAGSGILRFNLQSPEDRRFIDIFDKNDCAENWIIEADDWIILSQSNGTVTTEQRVLVGIDWSKVPADGLNKGTISVYNVKDGVKSGDAAATFDVEAVKSTVSYDGVRGYVEAGGYVAVEAENYTTKEDGIDGSYWKVIKSNAQHGDTMKSLPSGDYHTEDWGNTAKLHYSVYFSQEGTYKLTLNRQPTLSEGKTRDDVDRTMNVGIGVGNNAPTVLVGTRKTSGNWGNNVIRQYEPLSCDITVEQGWNDIVVYRSDADFVFDCMIIQTADGAVSTGRLGPWESPNNIVKEYAPAHVGPLPKELGEYLVLPNIVMYEGETILADIEGMTGFETPNSDVLVVAQKDDKLEIIAKRAGGAQFIVNTEKGSGTQKVIVCPKEDAGMGVYQEKDGLVVINAADAANDTRYTYRTPAKDNIHTWELDGTGLKVLPDVNGNSGKWDGEADSKDAPALTYTVEIYDAGTYYLFLNMSNPDVDGDSYHVFVDGIYKYRDKDSDYDGEKLWHTKGSDINLSEGRHTITISAREDGFSLNQLVLTQDKDSNFEGFLEVSEVTVPGPEITIDKLENITMDIGEKQTINPNAKADNGAEVTLTVESDDKNVVTVEVEGEKISLEAVAEGTAEIKVIADAEGCESRVETFQVAVKAMFDGEAYQEQNGRIVINAVDALQNSSYAMHSNEDNSEKYPSSRFSGKLKNL